MKQSPLFFNYPQPRAQGSRQLADKFEQTKAASERDRAAFAKREISG